MKRTAMGALAALLAGGIMTLAPASPAGATVTPTSSGGTLSVSVTGDDDVSFQCTGGVARANGLAATPSLACTAVTSITVTGDNGNQVIRLDDAELAFGNLASTTVTANGGNDLVFSTLVDDKVNTGSGDDFISVPAASVLDSGLTLGTGVDDKLSIAGTPSADKITVADAGLVQTANTTVGSSPTVARSFTGAEAILLDGRAGNDVLDAAGVSSSANAVYVSFSGGTGDDTLVGGFIQSNMSGDAGTNTYLGGPSADYAFTASDTDVIDLQGGANRIADTDSLRSGGRAISNSVGLADTYDNNLQRNDAVWRVRPGASMGTATAVASLNRPGIQQIPNSVKTLGAYFDSGSEPADHTLADIVALDDKAVFVTDGSGLRTLVDVTVPSGGWTTTGTVGSGTGTVDPTDPAYGTIYLNNVGTASVHGPWANKDRGFVHRATRDLVFRFASTATLDEGQAFLGDGTLTRAQFTASLMDTDEYRGLDVDRTFVKYLRRKADAGGRTYWINSIRNGKALWRFRAQLFGSPEYFAKAGGTNATYVVKAYNDVLGRDPDPSGRTYWTNKLDDGADRGSVALQFINSPEARRRLVDDQFLRFLDRKPTSTEQATWVAALPGATGEQKLVAYLVNSSGYYNRS